MNKFYIYGLVDPRINKIMYVGKGSGNRMFDHIRKAKYNIAESNNLTKLSGLKEILDSGYEDIAYCKLFETDDEVEAYEKEIILINYHHTHISQGGWNLTSGGYSGPSNKGKKLTESHKKNLSKSKKGIKFSDEHRLHISLNHVGNSGKHLSEEHRQKIGLSNKNKIRSKETLKNMSDAQKGKKHSKETKLKMSISHKKLWNKKRTILTNLDKDEG